MRELLALPFYLAAELFGFLARVVGKSTQRPYMEREAELFDWNKTRRP